MSGRELFVVLGRLAGILLLIEAIHTVATFVLLLWLASSMAVQLQREWGLYAAAVVIELAGAVVLLTATDRISRAFKWPDDDRAPDAAEIPYRRNPWMRVAERIAGLIALVAAVRPLGRLVAEPGTNFLVWRAVDAGALLLIATILLLRSRRGRTEPLRRVFE